MKAQGWAALVGAVAGLVLGLLVLETVGQIMILAVIGGVIGYFVPEVVQATRGASGGRGSASPAYRQLLRMTMGDREQAERLIRYERRYAPEANREQLIQRAIDRLEYDRMR
jgi:hypothetical protein